ncbi:MAG: hypothetical protein AUJ55_09735 [Proteobacteria bacterium CG1_02_64_396]|nr:MAG: hypothetical protein AUJ55_09735 [Proteobacteria bacterium CG1_02_64_396]
MRAIGLALGLLLGASAWADPSPLAGERLIFDLHYLGVPAGVAEMRVEPVDADGATAVVIEARSADWFNWLYRVRDTIVSTTIWGEKGLRSRRYSVDSKEGSYRNYKELVFSSDQVVETNPKETLTFPIPRPALDAVDGFYALRMVPLKVGQTVTFPLFDSRIFYDLEIEVERREVRKTPFGPQTPCVVVFPRLKSEGIFQRKGEMRIWLTDDARHIPVRMESKIAIGAVVAELRPDGYRPPFP